jgi:hypothetical protein
VTGLHDRPGYTTRAFFQFKGRFVLLLTIRVFFNILTAKRKLLRPWVSLSLVIYKGFGFSEKIRIPGNALRFSGFGFVTIPKGMPSKIHTVYEENQ